MREGLRLFEDIETTLKGRTWDAKTEFIGGSRSLEIQIQKSCRGRKVLHVSKRWDLRSKVSSRGCRMKRMKTSSLRNDARRLKRFFPVRFSLR